MQDHLSIFRFSNIDKKQKLATTKKTEKNYFCGIPEFGL
jgi:hypothetical protein